MSKPKLGFMVGVWHRYLGHFAGDAVLRAGHNTNGRARTPEEKIVEELEKRGRSSVGGPRLDDTIGSSPIDRRGPKFGVPETPKKPH